MKNKFQSICSQCGGKVAPGEGDTNKVENKWATAHTSICKSLVKIERKHPPDDIRQVVRDARNLGYAIWSGEYFYHPDYNEDDLNMYLGNMTSEDFNINEGCK